MAREVGADAFAHGATGKGNDQCRFQLAAEALDPTVKVIAPWRIEKFRQRFPGRNEMIAYCEAEEDPGQGLGGQALQLRRELPAHQLRGGQARRPDGQRRRAGRFRHDGLAAAGARQDRSRSRSASSRACRSSVNGRRLNAFEIVSELNEIGGRNGVGRIDMVENRFVGMKSRGVYEAPGMTILYAAHRVVEQLTLDRDLMHLRDRLAPEVAEMVYYGFWYHAKMDALMAFIREAQRPVTGEVTLNLYKGNIEVAGRTQPAQSLRRRHRQHGRRRLATTRPTPRAFCASRGCRAACRAASIRGGYEGPTRRRPTAPRVPWLRVRRTTTVAHLRRKSLAAPAAATAAPPSRRTEIAPAPRQPRAWKSESRNPHHDRPITDRSNCPR